MAAMTKKETADFERWLFKREPWMTALAYPGDVAYAHQQLKRAQELLVDETRRYMTAVKWNATYDAALAGWKTKRNKKRGA